MTADPGRSGTRDGSGGPGGDGGADEVVVRVDPARCVGAGLCAATAPRELALGEDGRAHPRRPATVPGEELAEAAELCPVEAITVVSARDGRRIAPAL